MAKNRNFTQEVSQTPQGVLVSIKNKLCIKLGIDGSILKILIDKYVSKCYDLKPGSKSHFAKVNMYNELTNTQMTIKSFFKFLRITNVANVKFHVSVTTSKGTQVEVEENMHLVTDDDLLPPASNNNQGEKDSFKQETNQTPQGVLVSIKNKICIKLGINSLQLKNLIDTYVNHAFDIRPDSKSHFAKVNMYNELTSSQMTIKSFFKFLKIMNVVNIKFTVAITTSRGTSVCVNENLNLFSDTASQPETLPNH